MDDQKEYIVAEFPDETKNGNTPMSVIPSNWLYYDEFKNASCWWPNCLSSNTELNNAIMNRTEYERSKCDLCSIKVKYRSNIYQSAIKRLKELEEMSSVSSNDESEKRRIIRNKRYDSFEESIDSDEENVPSFKNPARPTSQQVEKDLGNVNFKKNSTSQNCKTDSTRKSTSQKCDQNRVACTSTKSLSQNYDKGSLDYTPSNKQKSVNQDYEDDDLECTVTADEPVVTFNQLNNCCKKTKEMVHSLITKQEIMSKNIEYVLLLVQQIHSPLIRETENVHIKNLPAKDITTIQEFNTSLSDDAIFSEVSGTYAIVGGKDYADSTRKALSKLVSHELAMRMNWSGRNGRSSFKEVTNVVKLIIAVVRRNPLCRNVTTFDVEAIIKMWLRSAGDREGGRERRRHQ